MSNTKKLSKKTKKSIKHNVFVSLVITSVLLNLFFLVGLVVYNSTTRIDESVYSEAYNHYCVENYEDNLTRVVEEAEASNSDPGLAAAGFDIECRQGDFADYYDAAVTDYLSDRGYY